MFVGLGEGVGWGVCVGVEVICRGVCFGDGFVALCGV